MQTDNFLTAQHTHVAVMTSGGMDSALLLYLIAKEAAAKGVEVTALTIPGPGDSVAHAEEIVRLVNELTRGQVAHELLNPSTGADLKVTKGVTQAILQRRYRAIFLATTALPDHLSDALGAPNRPKTFHPVIQPWWTNTKDQVVECIRSLGLEQLISASHSCTMQDEGHCGWCWNCRERSWALG